MNTSGLARRLGAIFYDSLLVLALMFLGTLPFVAMRGGEPVESGDYLYQLTLSLIVYLFFVSYWSRYGHTLGMQAWRLKLETAVIGVKGTENLSSITPRGNTMTIGVQDVTDLIGQTGEEVPIGPNTVSIVLGDRSATLAVVVPPAVLDQFAGDNLDSPNPTTPEASGFPAQNALVQAGIVSQEDLDEAQSEDVDDTVGDGPVAEETEPPSFEDLGVTESGLDDIKENLFRADVQINFQQ